MNEGILELVEEVNKLHEENEALRIALREAASAGKKNRTGLLLKGAGAGMVITPLALWLAWKLVELVILAAGWLSVPTLFLGALSVCIVGGATLYLHSDGMLKKVDQILDLLLDEDPEEEEYYSCCCEKNLRKE